MSPAVKALIAAERLPESYAAIVAECWAPLADDLAHRLAEKSADRRRASPLVVGINGGQGSGKSTVCAFLEVLLKERGLCAVTLGLDDFYLTRAERQDKARCIHPLFATRGVPGTHDTVLLSQIVDQLCAGKSVELPQFDKASDDRKAQGKAVTGPVDIILFEGWCVGTSPQEEAALSAPINALEAQEDTAGVWRGAVNAALATDYAALFARIDVLVLLAVSGIDAVRRNRRLQEDKLAALRPDGSAVMDAAALERFIQHYERLTRHTLAEMPARADIVYTIDQNQRPTRR